MKKAKIFVENQFAGSLIENNNGVFIFTYSNDYLNSENCIPVSLTLPLREEPYSSKMLFSFFDG